MTISLSEFLAQLAANPVLAVTVALTLGVVLVNGWTDAPNAIATCVSTRAMSARSAILMAAVFNFLGVLVMTMVNASVAATIYNMVDFGGNAADALTALCAALVAIVAWATAAWWFGIPASEGPPGTVALAVRGGLTSCVLEDGKVYSVKRKVDETLCFAAIVPDYKLLTEAARAALPKEVSHKDAVYNLSRAALVPAAFCEGRHDLLAIATEDKLDQPYRMPLMPGSKEVCDMARLCGAKAVYVSGAGSTVMAVAEKAEAEKFYSKLEKGLELLEGLDGCEAFTLLRLDADNTGATVE